MQDLTWVDYVILAIFLLSFIAGLSRGIVKEIISLLTLIAAFVVSIMFSNQLAAAFTSSPSAQTVTDHAAAAAQPISYAAIGLSFGLLFAGTVIVGSIVGFIINLAFRSSILGFGNRLMGGIFGICRGFIINLVLIFLVQLTSFSTDDVWANSKLVHSYQPAVQWLGDMISPTLNNLKSKLSDTNTNTNTNEKSNTTNPIEKLIH